ncbi:MAG: aminopeptidase P N-terminal domain-containing protein, partial [Gammaproteobacteria bacterium]
MTLHIHPTEFAKRREKLIQAIGIGNRAVIATNPEYLRNGDTYHSYRPDSNFYYLTGFPEPEAIAVFIPGRPEGEYILFCRENNPEKEIWDGCRIGLEQACMQYGAQQAFPIEQFPLQQAALYAGRQQVDLLPLLAEMRLFKSPAEIQL